MRGKRQTAPGVRREHYPEIDQQYIEGQTQDNAQDRNGSYPGNRRGPLHGAPNVTWFSTNNKTREINIDVGAERKIYVQGYNMSTMSNLYLSGSSIDMFETPVKTFSFFETMYENRLVEENPRFTGIQLSEWTVVNDNNITFMLPKTVYPGEIDIVLQGPAGYNLASESVFTETFSDKKVLEVTLSGNS